METNTWQTQSEVVGSLQYAGLLDLAINPETAILIRIYWPFNISAIADSPFPPFRLSIFRHQQKILRFKVSGNKLQATNEQIPFLISSCHCLCFFFFSLFSLPFYPILLLRFSKLVSGKRKLTTFSFSYLHNQFRAFVMRQKANGKYEEQQQQHEQLQLQQQLLLLPLSLHSLLHFCCDSYATPVVSLSSLSHLVLAFCAAREIVVKVNKKH